MVNVSRTSHGQDRGNGASPALLLGREGGALCLPHGGARLAIHHVVPCPLPAVEVPISLWASRSMLARRVVVISTPISDVKDLSHAS